MCHISRHWNSRQLTTGVPRSQKNAPTKDPTVGLCLGSYGGHRGVAVSYERGIPTTRLRQVRAIPGMMPKDTAKKCCKVDGFLPHTQHPPCRQPRGKFMVSLVIFHTNATRIGWHLWEIDLRFATGLPSGWVDSRIV